MQSVTAFMFSWLMQLIIFCIRVCICIFLGFGGFLFVLFFFHLFHKGNRPSVHRKEYCTHTPMHIDTHSPSVGTAVWFWTSLAGFDIFPLH